MKKSLLIVVLISFAGLLVGQTTRTWTATSAGSATTASNWSGNVAPANGDTLIFDGTSVQNCTWDVVSTVQVGAIRLLSGYTGTVTTTSGTKNFRHSIIVRSGTFNGALGPLRKVSSGQNGFFEVTGGTFNHGSGNFQLSVDAGDVFSFVGNVTLNTLTLQDATNTNADREINFGTNTTVNSLSYPSGGSTDPINFQGIVHIKNTMNITSYIPSIAPTGVNTGTFIFDGTNATLSLPTPSAPCFIPNIEINVTSNYNINGELPVTGNWQRTSGNLTAGSSTVYLWGTSNSIIGNASFHNLNLCTGSSYGISTGSVLSVVTNLNADGQLNLPASSTVTVGGDLVNTAAISGNATCSVGVVGNHTCFAAFSIGDDSRINIGGSLTGTAAISTGNTSTITITGSLSSGGLTTGTSNSINIGTTFSNSGLFTSGSSNTINVAGNYTCTGGLSLGGTSTINVGANLSGAGSITTANSAVMNVVGAYDCGGGLLLTSSSALNVGTDLTGAGSIVTTNNSTINVVGSYTAGGGLNLGSNSKANIAGNMLGTGSVLLASNATASVVGTFTCDGGITMNASSRLVLGGNFERNSAITADATATLMLNGSSAQGINGSNGLTIGIVNLATNGTRNVTVSGGGLSILDALEIGNNITFNTGGLLGLESTSALTARVGQLGTGSSISGTALKKTVIPGGTTGWANLGSPGITSQTFSSWDTYTGIGSTGIPMMCTGCQYSPLSVSGMTFNSVQGWVESTCLYDSAKAASTAINLGQGYWVYVGDGIASTSDLALINNGNLAQGNIPVGLTASGACADVGANLLANPYASPISFDAFMAANPTTSTGIAGYFAWNADINNHEFYPSGGPGTGNATGTIAAGQGFYVVVGSARTLTFTEACKTGGNTNANPLLRGGHPNAAMLRLQSPNFGESDVAMLRLNSQATENFDYSFDMKKVKSSPGYLGYPGPYSNYMMIYTSDLNGTDYAVNTLPLTETNSIIPLGVQVTSNGTYTISPENSEQFATCLFLHDKQLEVYHDLKSKGDYIFSVNNISPANRFELVLCANKVGTALAIEDANLDQNKVLVSKTENAVLVTAVFTKAETATIEAYNLLGQRLTAPVTVVGTQNTVSIPSENAGDIIVVKVSTATNVYTKKVVLK